MNLSIFPTNIINKIFFFTANRYNITKEDLIWEKYIRLQFREQYCVKCGELERKYIKMHKKNGLCINCIFNNGSKYQQILLYDSLPNCNMLYLKNNNLRIV